MKYSIEAFLNELYEDEIAEEGLIKWMKDRKENKERAKYEADKKARKELSYSIMNDPERKAKAKKIFKDIEACAKKVYSRLSEKTGYEVCSFSNSEFEDFIYYGTISYISFDIDPIAKKYNTSPREVSDNSDAIKEINKSFDECVKFMKEELNKARVKYIEVEYGGDWDDGPFDVEIDLRQI